MPLSKLTVNHEVKTEESLSRDSLIDILLTFPKQEKLFIEINLTGSPLSTRDTLSLIKQFAEYQSQLTSLHVVIENPNDDIHTTYYASK